MKSTQKETGILKRIVQTALFIALAVAVRSFSTMVYFMGAPGMRISFSPIFARIPALIFGPLYGGLAGGIVDILGYLLKPEGAYLPLMTLTAVLDGVLTGFLWKGLKEANTRKIQRNLWIAFGAMGLIGLANYANTMWIPDSPITKALAAIGKNKGYLVLGLVAVSATGLLLMTLDYVLQRKFPNSPVHKNYLKLLLVFGFAGLTVSFLNTIILQLFVPELGKLAFVVFLIPRLVKEVFMIVIQGYLTAFLLSLYDRAAVDR